MKPEPMREDELREAVECALCGEKISKSGLPLFWRVRLTRHGLNKGALDRQQGLTMMLGGHAALARVMGANEEMTSVLSSREVTVCEPCCSKNPVLYALGLSDTDDDADDDDDDDCDNCDGKGVVRDIPHSDGGTFNAPCPKCEPDG